ncbi:cobalamin-dependent protein [Candidatus Pacearchaeota archaeon]|nr:cobalamin-dependent protein [Candidatus Pacearchaeota archaeon]
MVNKKINLKLIEAPTASLKINGERLGTDRIRTPVPTQPILLPSLEKGLDSLGYKVDSEIINMKLGDYHEYKKGTIDLQGLQLENYVLGAPFESVKDSLKEADVIGLTSNFTYSANVVKDFIGYAKKVNPNLKIVVGGADASTRQDFYLHSGADAVVKGEGENNGHYVIDALTKGYGLEDIARVAFKKGDRIIKTVQGLGNEPINLNELPFPSLHKVNLADYIDTGEGPLPKGASTPIWAYTTSRGCPNFCPYCTTPFLKPNFRKMSLERIAQYFEYIKKAGVKTLISNEDSILRRMGASGSPRDPNGRIEVIEYAKLIMDTGLPFELANGLEIGKLANRKGEPDIELINSFFKHRINPDGSFSGTYRCYIPLESVTDEGISRLKKLRSYEIEKNVLRAIAETKVPMLNFGIMVGAPNETPQNIDKTRERCYEIKEMIGKISPDTQLYFNFFMSTLLPGTPYFKKYENRLIADINTQPEFWSFYISGINGDYYSAKDMTLKRRELSKEINGTHAMQVYDGQNVTKK